MKTEFHRITRLPSYVFAEVNKLKARYRDQGHDIIDFGMGNPDICLLYTSPSPRDLSTYSIPSSA